MNRSTEYRHVFLCSVLRVLCQKWIGRDERDIERFPSASMAWRCVETVGFGTPMTAPKTGLTLPLPLQFLAAWLAV